MDAMKFIEERYRMCDYYRGGNARSGCAECPVFQMCVPARSVTAEYIAAVEQWSKEHPRKTRQSVFLEQFPNAKIVEEALAICPYNLGLIDKCKSKLGRLCFDCRREFWMQEVE